MWTAPYQKLSLKAPLIYKGYKGYTKDDTICLGEQSLKHANVLWQFCTTSPVGILLGCCWDFVGMTIQGPKIVGMDPNYLHPNPRPTTPQDLFESIIFLYQNEMF